MFYIFIQDDKLNVAGEFKQLTEGVFNCEVDEDLYNDFVGNRDKYIVGEKEIEIEVPDFFEDDEEYQEIVLDENGMPVLDDEGNLTFETKTRKVQKPLMVDKTGTRPELLVDEETGVPILDEEGNEQYVEVEYVYQAQSTHKEPRIIPYPILDPDYEEKRAQKERERLSLLNLTAADVERAIYKAKGLDFEDIVELVKDNPLIDVKALKIELKANNFYRGNPYVEQIGTLLGYTSDDLDYLFENKELPSVDNSENDVENPEDIETENSDTEGIVDPDNVDNLNGEVNNDV